MDRYYIIFNGELLPDFGLEEAKEAFAGLENLPLSLVDELFSGKPAVLRVTPSCEDLAEYRPRLEHIGMSVTVETQAPQGSLYLQELKSRHAPGGQNHLLERPKVQDYSRYYDTLTPPPRLFRKGLTGRYGRLAYANAALLLCLACLPPSVGAVGLLKALSHMANEAITRGAALFLLVILLPIFFFLIFRVTALRLHDLNLPAAAAALVTGVSILCALLSRGLSLLMLLPLVFGIILVAVPGTPGINTYGPPSRRGSLTGLMIYLLLIMTGAIVTIASTMQVFSVNTP